MSATVRAARPSVVPARGTDAGPGELVGVVEGLREAVSTTPLALEVPGVQAARDLAAVLLDQIDDYLLPRLRRLDAPLLAVVGGSTGAGKSTLVNSLLGREVSPAGVLRPTTRQPTLVHAPADAAWFADGGLLPHLPRASGARAPDARGLLLLADEDLPSGLALLDAPDIDSVVDANRELARQLLAAADLWLFVTTAARYADAVPWELLGEASERGTSVAVVLDRVPPAAMPEVRADLARMLSAAGLSGAPLFTITESALEEGRLPEAQLAPLRRWLGMLADDSRSRDVVVRRTLAGALASLTSRVTRLAEASDAQDHEARVLGDAAGAAYDLALSDLSEALADGTLLRGEVLARWHELVGTGEVFASIQAGVGRLRDRVVAAVSGRRAPAQRLEEALVTGVAVLILDAVGAARERSLRDWRARPAGEALLTAIEGTELDDIADPRLPQWMGDEVERLVRGWQGYILDLVRQEASGRRARALAMSLGVSGAGAVLMLVVFAASAGVTGAEAGIAAGTAALAQRVLQAAFGDQAVRTLARTARDDLLDRVTDLLAAEREQLEALLPPRQGVSAAGWDGSAGQLLRDAALGVFEVSGRGTSTGRAAAVAAAPPSEAPALEAPAGEPPALEAPAGEPPAELGAPVEPAPTTSQMAAAPEAGA